MARYVPDEQRSFRTAFVVLGVLFAVASAWAIYDEAVTRRPWKRLQTDWLARQPDGTPEPAVRQIVVPGLGPYGSTVIDRCPTCHLGIEDPAMEDPEVPRVLRAHPRREALLGAHPPERFGCTPCHRGQGLALTAGTAHGEDDPHWPDPMLRGRDVEAGCLSCHPEEESLAGAPRLSLGRTTFRELGCGGCHALPAAEAQPDGKRGPSLRHVGSRLLPGRLLAWIREPEQRRRGHRMPQFWPGAAAARRDEESLAIAAHLLHASVPFPAADEAPAPDPALAEAGRRLFDRLGCRGCHVIGGEGHDDVRIGEEKAGDGDAWAAFGGEEEDEESPAAPPAPPRAIDFGPALGRLGAQVRPGFLHAWLLDPAAFWPEAVMPDLRITPAEARALASYLASLGAGDAPPDPPGLSGRVDPALAATGRELIARYGCAGCHDIPGFEGEGRIGPDLTGFGRKDAREMDFGREPLPPAGVRWARYTETKLRTPRAFETEVIAQTMPDFGLSDAEVEGLAVYLRGLGRPPPPPALVVRSAAPEADAGARLFEARNCHGCHDLAGREADLARYYDEAHLRPPPLQHEGLRAQPQWLLGFLLDPFPLRPWLDVRMPRFRFSEAEARAVTAHLARLAGQPGGLRHVAVRPIAPERSAQGAAFFAELKCVSCHTAGAAVESAQRAPDLRLARQRLDPAWVRRFLVDPNALLPGTRMPQFFPQGETPFPGVLGGDVDAQIDLLVDHLMNLGLEPAAPPVASAPLERP